MALTTADLKSFTARYRLQCEIGGLAVLTLIVAVMLGVMARRQAAPLVAERERLRAASAEIQSFRGAFQPATAEEDAFQFPDTLSVGVARDVRFTLAQQVSQRAEQAGLRDVRVRFAPADTGSAPQVPDLPGGSVSVANYSISIDCRGDLSAVLTALRNLPPSVALQHLTAVRDARGTVGYHVTLAVFETAAEATHG